MINYIVLLFTYFQIFWNYCVLRWYLLTKTSNKYLVLFENREYNKYGRTMAFLVEKYMVKDIDMDELYINTKVLNTSLSFLIGNANIIMFIHINGEKIKYEKDAKYDCNRLELE